MRLLVRSALLLAALACVPLPACTEQRAPTQSQGAPLEKVTLVRSRVDVPASAHHPIVRLSLVRPGRAIDLGLGYDGILLPTNVALIVRPDETLEAVDETSARRLATEVLPDFALDRVGARVAIVRRAGDGSALHIVDARIAGRESVRVLATPTLIEADRPLFLDDDSILFVGTANGALPAFHRIDLKTLAVTKLPTSNDAIPAFRAGYRRVGNDVLFDDGARLRSLDLGTFVVRDLGASP